MCWVWIGVKIDIEPWNVWYDSIHMVWLWYGMIMIWYDSIPTIPRWYGIPIQSGMVWYEYGMVWFHYGMVWVWYGMTIVWYDSIHMVWLSYGMIMVWHDSIPTIPVWYGMTPFLPFQCGTGFLFHLVWHSHSNVVWFPIPSGMVIPYHGGMRYHTTWCCVRLQILQHMIWIWLNISISKQEHLIPFGVVCKGQIGYIHVLPDYFIGISELFTDRTGLQ